MAEPSNILNSFPGNPDDLLNERIRFWDRIHPSWWSVINLIIAAYGIFIAEWSYYQLIYVFWMEMLFTACAMLVRVSGAMDYLIYFTVSGEKIAFFFIGILLGTAAIMLVVALTYDMYPPAGLSPNLHPEIRIPVILLGINHFLRMVFHYYLNGRFRKANPATEMIVSFTYMVSIDILLIVIVLRYMHLVPVLKDVAKAVAAVLGTKFLSDLLYSGFHRTVIEWLTPTPKLQPAAAPKNPGDGSTTAPPGP